MLYRSATPPPCEAAASIAYCAGSNSTRKMRFVPVKDVTTLGSSPLLDQHHQGCRPFHRAGAQSGNPGPKQFRTARRTSRRPHPGRADPRRSRGAGTTRVHSFSNSSQPDESRVPPTEKRLWPTRSAVGVSTVDSTMDSISNKSTGADHLRSTTGGPFLRVKLSHC